MEKIKQWAELKRAVFCLAQSASAVIAEAAESIFQECSQRVKTGFHLEEGKAEVYLSSGGFEISGHAPKSALESHWAGTIDEWAAVKSEIRRLTNKDVVKEELAARL